MKISVLLIVAISFIACEGNTSREWKVRNHSEGDIRILLCDETEITIAPFEMKTIKSTDVRGGQNKPGSPFCVTCEMIVYSDSTTSNKDCSLNENWVISTTQRSKRPSDYYHEFVHTVNDEDFE